MAIAINTSILCFFIIYKIKENVNVTLAVDVFFVCGPSTENKNLFQIKHKENSN